MKTFALFLIFTSTLLLTANAQITKGNWMVGGSGSFSSSTARSEDSSGSGNEIESKATGFRINPNVGYFLTDKFAAGLGVGVGFSNPPERNNSNWSLGFGPFVRYYFLETNNRINIFGETKFNYGFGISDTNKDRNSTLFGFSAGGVLFFNSSVGLELSLNYTDTTSRSDRSTDTNYNDLFIGLGFQIHLEK